MITCSHWNHIGIESGGYCSLHKLTCSYGVCNNCQDFEQASKLKLALRRARIGDKIATATTAVGIKPCGACKKRQAILNGESPDTSPTIGANQP
jgi:hypothetical protein